MRTEYAILLECFMWGIETFSRPDCGWILAGYRHTRSEREINRLLERLRRERFLEQHGRGRQAQFRISAAGRQQVQPLDPARVWQEPWDGKWRVFTFDLPLQKNDQRMVLWRALRHRKFGLLQQSVWVWPRDVELILQEILEAHGIPECFCGFEAGRLFLCNDAEVAAVAWDFEEIGRRHQTYLQHAVATPETLKRADDLQSLARIARVERDAFAYAFSLDPLLPRALWPPAYRGGAVAARHRTFSEVLTRRLRDLTGR